MSWSNTMMRDLAKLQRVKDARGLDRIWRWFEVARGRALVRSFVGGARVAIVEERHVMLLDAKARGA